MISLLWLLTFVAAITLWVDDRAHRTPILLAIIGGGLLVALFARQLFLRRRVLSESLTVATVPLLVCGLVLHLHPRFYPVAHSPLCIACVLAYAVLWRRPMLFGLASALTRSVRSVWLVLLATVFVGAPVIAWVSPRRAIVMLVMWIATPLLGEWWMGRRWRSDLLGRELVLCHRLYFASLVVPIVAIGLAKSSTPLASGWFAIELALGSSLLLAIAPYDLGFGNRAGTESVVDTFDRSRWLLRFLWIAGAATLGFAFEVQRPIIFFAIAAVGPLFALAYDPFAIRRVNISRAMSEHDSDDALSHWLQNVRELGAAGTIIVRSPYGELEIDRAGYQHTRTEPPPHGEVPAQLWLEAENEPFFLIRTELLELLEIPRPDLRPSLGFLRSREADFALLLRCGYESVGLLLLSAPQLRLNRLLADDLASACEQLAARVLHRSEAHRWHVRADAQTQAVQQLHAQLKDQIDRSHLLESALTKTHSQLRPLAVVAHYSTAARTFSDDLTRVAATSQPVVLAHPLGCDPLPYVRELFAIWLKAHSREHAPFVIAENSESLFESIAAAKDGLLMLRSPLSRDTMTDSALRHLEHSQTCRLVYVVATLAPPTQVPAPLASLSPALLSVPRLVDRAEDIESLVLDTFARLTLGLHGEIFGMAPQALARLVNHDWPGDLAELEGVAAAAVRSAGKSRVELENLPEYLRTA